MRFTYPAILAGEDGGLVAVSFRDLPEALTTGTSEEDALWQAGDCLGEALATRIADGLEVPQPSAPHKGEHLASPPALIGAKAALYVAMRETGTTNVALAKKLKCDEKFVRLLLNPRHGSGLPKIEAALRVLGRRLIIGVRAA